VSGLRRTVLILFWLVPILALGGDARPVQAQNWRERNERKVRILRLVGLADALQLDETQALRMEQRSRPFDEQRRALELEIARWAEILKKASEGDPAALGQVDRAISGILDARTEVQALNRDLINTLGKELSPQQRAKMAIFFGEFENDMRRMQNWAEAVRARREAFRPLPRSGEENAPGR
jgi:hypothetical protein